MTGSRSATNIAPSKSRAVDGSGAVPANVTVGAGVKSVENRPNRGCEESIFTTSSAPLASALGTGVPSDCSSDIEN